MIFQHLSKQSLVAYIRHFEQLLAVNDNENLRKFLDECKKELDKRK